MAIVVYSCKNSLKSKSFGILAASNVVVSVNNTEMTISLATRMPNSFSLTERINARVGFSRGTVVNLTSDRMLSCVI